MSAIPNKIESLQKVDEGMHSQKTPHPMEDVERTAPNRENFQKFMEPQKIAAPRSDIKPFAISEGPEKLETNPIFAEENVSAQKSGTATDQDQKKRGQSDAEEVEKAGSVSSKKGSSTTSTSLMDEINKLNTHASNLKKLSPEELKNQVHDIINKVNKAKAKLSDDNVKIRAPYQALLTNKLTHIDDHIKIALSKAGVEYTPLAKTEDIKDAIKQSPKGGVERVLDLLTNTQHQLETVDTTIANLNLTSGHTITPANMLAIQMKMGYVQQQIELFTSLLNKALESTKTIMNVQV